MTHQSHTPDTMNVPTLDDFIAAAKAAGSDGEIRVELDAQGYRVLAAGRTPNGRDVSWVASPKTDAVALYLASFQKRFGERLTDAVMANFTDELDGGKPLSARTVSLAAEIVDRSLTALSGVDFLSHLNSSAAVKSIGFESACRKLKIDGAALSADARKRIDTDLQQRFQAALLNGESPVAQEQATRWLEDCLRKENSRTGSS